MKMMVVGGKRSKEFAESIQNQFSISTTVLPGFSLEDIEQKAILGNIMERVLILEQAWTLDGISTDEREMRKRIGEMTKQARERGGNEQYVFMARSRESAQLCFEETYDICERTAVVLYEQKATVVILHELLCCDIAGLRPVLVYNPPITAIEEPYTVVVDVKEYAELVTTKEVVAKRVIKKTRGSAIQRSGGTSPWYSNNQMGEVQMYGKKDGINAMFSPTQFVAKDKGFSDETPLVPSGALDMRNQLQHMFKQVENSFEAHVVPAATIPVAPVLPVSDDLTSFIREKAYKGYVLSFLGPGGSGSTFMALNCAARIYAAGFSVLFIDGDLTGHSAQYLTKLGVSEDVLLAEVDARVLRTGFTMYSATQFLSKDGHVWMVPDKIAKDYDFIVADIPFSNLVQASPFIGNTTRIVITVDSSNWGIGKAVMSLFNAPINIAPIIREKGRLLYNRSDKLSAGLFGVQVTDITGINNRVTEVFGARAFGYTALPVKNVIGSYSAAEEYWYTDRLFSDSQEGGQLFNNILFGLLE